ncbi:MAG TPA: hypothetical protein V6C84_20740 [Coleofasciculaceae cyanobacterium]
MKAAVENEQPLDLASISKKLERRSQEIMPLQILPLQILPGQSVCA